MAVLIGGRNDDVLTGGIAADYIDGGRGNDTLSGGGGNDRIYGGDGNDSLAGGTGDDHLDGGAGDDTLAGGDGHDELRGGAGNDAISGGVGNDEIDGGSGNDTISGGAGDDEVDGGYGNDNISGGDGRDELRGGADNDTLSGDAGNDDLEGGSGNDTLAGGTGNDEIDGGDGNDTVLWKAGDGSDVVYGGRGTDTLVVTTSDSVQQTVRVNAASHGRLVITVEGAGGGVITLNSIEDLRFVVGSGGARIIVGPGVTLPPLSVAGGDGNNVIDQSGTTQAASINAGAGDDVVLAGNGADTVLGGDGNDVIKGAGGADMVDGGTGNDRVAWSAGDGNDVVQGGDGVDELDVTLSAAGASSLVVGADDAGNVILTSGGERITADGVEAIVINAAAAGSTVAIGSLAGTDVAQNTVHFVGNAGADVLDGSATDRRIEAQGNGGSDTLLGSSVGDSLDGGADNDTLRGNAGNDVLDGGAGIDTVDYSTDPNGVAVNLSTGVATDGFGSTDTLLGIENANGSAFADVLTGDDAANVLAGLGGNDTLRGNAGADTIDGGAGDDSITGGAGNDTLTGGTGADRYFVVDPGQTTVNTGSDTITDFAANDVIDLTPVPTIASLEQLLAVSRQEGADTVIELGSGNSIRLAGVALGSLTAANFVFTTPIVGTANLDMLVGTAGNDLLQGLGGLDFLQGLAGSDVLDGGAGSDFATYSSEASSIVANLSASAITVGGVTVQSNTVRSGAGDIDTLLSIEGVIGTNLNDTLIGGAGPEALNGFGGADTIVGGDGNDVMAGADGIDSLDGGAGFDIVQFESDTAVLGSPLLQITVNPDGSITSVNVRTGEIETAIVNFEMLVGSAGNDAVTGGAGNDFLGGAFGSDVVDGGAGIDTVVYTHATVTVQTIDLAAGTSLETRTVAGPPGMPSVTFTGVDTLRNIENVIGSASGETIVGNAGNNVLEGYFGNDVLRGGAGNDTLSGGASVLLTHPEAVISVAVDGTDTVDYSTDPNAVNVNLLTGTATDGFGGTDTLISIENANGSAFADTITGNDAANALQGLAGNDTLRGNAGTDTIDGGLGDDSITGGAGNDTLIGGGGGDRYFLIDPGQTVVNIGNDTITDFAGDVIDLTPIPSITSLAQVLTISRQEGADSVIDLGGGNSIRLTGVALGSLTAANFVFASPPGFPPGSIVGTEGNDTLTGTPAANFIFGLGGNDSLLGQAGADLLDGGEGNDTAIYLSESGPIVANLSAVPIVVGGITVQPNTVRDGAGSVDTLVGIENIGLLGPASSLADTLIGSAGANQLSGGGGADTILGGDGGDTISGGAGIDVMDGGDGFDFLLLGGDIVGTNVPGLRITINADGSITSVGPTETEANIPNFEMVSGSGGNDTITGNGGDNFLGGAFGSDIIDGGAGVDTAHYQFNVNAAGVPLTIDLAAGTSSETFVTPSVPIPGVPQQTFTASDTLISIENLRGSTGTDNIYGDAGDNILQGFFGDDLLRGRAGNDTLDGGASPVLALPAIVPGALDGTDTADYSTDPDHVAVNLLTGTATDGFGGADTLLSIENVNGSAFADTITGNGVANLLAGLAGADTLNGGDGDDRLIGGTGVDVIDGGAGFDIVDFSADAIAASAPGLAIAISGTTVTAQNAALAEIETATNVEAVIGSLGDDVVTGGAGDDTYIAGVGDDRFDGGGGSDTVRLDTAVVVDLAAGSVQGVNGTLALANVENVTASANADTLRGSAAANTLMGGLGDDVLMGRGGSDTLIGGTPGVASTDIDTVDYSDDVGSVTVNLAAGTAVDGGGATDTLIGIERAIGSGFADTLIGDGGNNVLTGLAGGDALTGGAGADSFVATADVVGNANFGNDTITDFNVAQDSVNLRAISAIGSFADVQARLTQSGADALLTVSAGHSVRFLNVNAASLTANNFVLLNLNIVGTDAAETLTGDTGNDSIQGRGGNDTLLGLAGNDTLDGGAGTDILNGGPGNDTLIDPDFTSRMIGGAGNDTFNGNTPYYGADPSGIVVNLAAAPLDVNGDGTLVLAGRTVRDGYGDVDTLAPSVSNLEASYFNDQVVGSAGADTITLYAGNDRALGMDGGDTFWGGSGNDYMDGGAGIDSLNYGVVLEDGGPAAIQGVRLNMSGAAVDIGGGVVLAANTAIDQYGHTDSVFNFEFLSGSQQSDVIVGSATTFSLNGLDGNDTLLGGSANESLSGGTGNDVIDGGAGVDSASFFGSTGAVVNLVTQVASDGTGGTDLIRNVENISGGQFADDFTGDDSSNGLFGNAGNDTLRGNGGADSLDGGDGDDTLQGGDGNDQLGGGRNNDMLTGGAGQDTFMFFRSTQPPVQADLGVDVVTDFSVADDLLNVSQVPELTSIEAVLSRATEIPGLGVRITINPVNSIQLNGLTLADLPLMRIQFAPIVGTPADDVLDGTSSNDFINGFAGNDTINGRGGSDSLDGGDGNDTLNGGDDFDQLFGQTGNDTLNGGAGNDFMNSGAGDDTLTGGAGSDTFRSTSFTPNPAATGFGRDVYTDFNVAEDRLDLSAIAGMTSRDALNAAAAQSGADVVITIDATSSITIRNLTVAELDGAIVSFAPFVTTPGDDTVNGSSGSDFINGEGGSDTLAGNGGNDALLGGDGNDALSGGDGADNLIGGNDNDTLSGDAGVDTLDGGSGNDTLTGGADTDFFVASTGNDTIMDLQALGDVLDLRPFPAFTSREAIVAASTQVGPDFVINLGGGSSLTLRNFSAAQLPVLSITFAPLTGTEGNDVLNGSNDFETINGLGGDDVVNGNGGSDTISGGAGNDTLNGGDGADFMLGDDGNDALSGGADSDRLDGGLGNDTATGGAATDTFVMGPGQDVVTDFVLAEDQLDVTRIPSLTSRAALLAAAAPQGSSDVLITIDASTTLTIRNFTMADLAQANVAFAPIIGTPGDDVLNGSQDDNVVEGLSGDDVLNGGAGNDNLFGGDGNDTLNGDAGFDFLSGGNGNDTIDGGDDVDTVDYSPAPTGIFADLAAGTASDGAGGSDVLSDIENVYASGFNDVVVGDGNGNTLLGFAGNDALLGRGGDDNLSGFEGDDTLTGGTGNDFLWGGAGDDLFVFAEGDGLDMISSFEAGAGSDDVIDLQAFGFADFAAVQAVTDDDGFGNALIDLGDGNQVTLLGVTESALNADDFLL